MHPTTKTSTSAPPFRTGTNAPSSGFCGSSFGELFISQRNSTFDSRYKFTAKELDNETKFKYCKIEILNFKYAYCLFQIYNLQCAAYNLQFTIKKKTHCNPPMPPVMLTSIYNICHLVNCSSAKETVSSIADINSQQKSWIMKRSIFEIFQKTQTNKKKFSQ